MLLETLERALGDVLGTLTVEPERAPAVDAARVFEVANDLERAVVACKTLFAGRAADAGVWREKGHKSAASWMAETSGTGLSEVNGMLETSERLRSLPETDQGPAPGRAVRSPGKRPGMSPPYLSA